MNWEINIMENLNSGVILIHQSLSRYLATAVLCLISVEFRLSDMNS